jgi:hypothetical protein
LGLSIHAKISRDDTSCAMKLAIYAKNVIINNTGDPDIVVHYAGNKEEIKCNIGGDIKLAN